MCEEKLTVAERKKISDAYAMQKAVLKLTDKDELPTEVRQRVRQVTLEMIFAARKAKAAKTQRTKEYRAAEDTFSWRPVRRR
ncbi:TPA: hypothetical protein ACW0I5_004602 [Escherichia coli]